MTNDAPYLSNPITALLFEISNLPTVATTDSGYFLHWQGETLETYITRARELLIHQGVATADQYTWDHEED
jgi:hypothetical protein